MNTTLIRVVQVIGLVMALLLQARSSGRMQAAAYYVNDGSTNRDVYCSSRGDDLNDGRSPAGPKASLATLLAERDLEPGDVVYVDTGVYSLGGGIVIVPSDQGAAGSPVTIRGSTVSGGSVLDLHGLSGDVIRCSASYVVVENLSLTGAPSGGGFVPYDGSVRGEGHDTTLRNCRVYGNGYGVWINWGPVNTTVQNCLMYGNSDSGVYAYSVGSEASNTRLLNNTIVADGANGLRFGSRSGRPTLRNNIIQVSGTGKFAIKLEEPVALTSDYNDLYVKAGAAVGLLNVTLNSLADWRAATGQDAHSVSVDPLFANPSASDYHLQSSAGSYHGGVWTADASDSPGIDAGDPASAVGSESQPNGGVINLGAYGGTEQASRTPGVANTAPSIVVHPQNQQIDAGATVVFGVTASGTLPLLYQWRFNGIDVPGATSNTLTLIDVQEPNTGIYEVVVTNTAGSDRSLPASLVVSSKNRVFVNVLTSSGSIANRGLSWLEAWSASSASGDALAVIPGTVQLENARHDSDGRWRVIRPFLVFQIENVPAGTEVTKVTLSLRVQSRMGDSIKDAQTYLRLVRAQPANPANLAVTDFSTVLPFAITSYSSAHWLTNMAVGQMVVIPLNQTAIGSIRNGTALTVALMNGHELQNTDHFTEPNVHNHGIQFFGPGSVNPPKLIVDYKFSSPSPSISSQPQSQTASVGGSVTFTVTANGAAPTSFQWRFKGANISGATSSSLTVSNVLVSSAGIYDVVVSNADGSITSEPALLEVNIPPSINLTSLPPDSNYTSPARITLVATAQDSDGSISMVEFFFSTNNSPTPILIGAVLASPYSYSWTNVAAGEYTLTARATDNSGATSNSAPVLVTVRVPPPLNDFFENRVSLFGNSVVTNASNAGATFEVSEPEHAGNGRYHSVWWTWRAPGPGLVTLTTRGSDFNTLLAVYTGFSVNALTPVASDQNNGVNGSSRVAFATTAGATYQIAVDGYNGRSGNIVLDLKFNQAPTVVLTSPANGTTLNAPATVVLSADASDPGGEVGQVEFYQGTNLLSRVFAAPYFFVWNNVAAGIYPLKAVATDTAGATNVSSTVTLTVTGQTIEKPAITIQPVSQSAAIGAAVSFTAAVTGTSPLIYQWLFNGTPLAGAQSPTLTLPNVQAANVGRYSLFVTNSAGSDTSREAVLTVESISTPGPFITREDLWVPNGPVRSIVQTNGVIYLGGDFDYVGPNTGGGAALSAVSGAPVEPFPRVSGFVNAVVADGSGGWFIGGNFTAVGGIQRANLAHIRGDGTVNPGWSPQTAGPVQALALAGNTLFVGGLFTSVNLEISQNLAAVAADTGALIQTWNPAPTGPVHALAAAGSLVYVGGQFDRVSGQNRRNIAAIEIASGNATAWNPDANNVAEAIVFTNNLVYVGGQFTSIGRQQRRALAALEPATGGALGNATSWYPSPNNTVRAIAVSGGVLYAGGEFNLVNANQPTSLARPYLAAFDLNTGIATGWNPSVNNSVWGLAVSGGTVYIAGQFTRVSGQNRLNVAALQASTPDATTWNPSANGLALAVAVASGRVFVGGEFTSAGGRIRNHLAALDAANGKLTDWDPNAGDTIRALAIAGNSVLIGGDFQTISGVQRSRVAAIDAATGVPVPQWTYGANDIVYALSVEGNKVYAGGAFTSIGGGERTFIAALDRTTGALIPTWNAQANGAVYALVPSGDSLFVGGDFSNIGRSARNRLAALDTASGTAIPGWLPDSDGRVHTLAVSANTLYVGGFFANVNRQPRPFAAAVDALTGALTPWNPGAENVVWTLLPAGNAVYAGGNFTRIGGEDRHRIASLNAATGEPNEWNPGAAASVLGLAASGTDILVGGEFTQIGGRDLPNLAAFVEGAPRILNHPGSQGVPPGANVTLEVRVTGAPPLGYQWRLNGVNIPGATDARIEIRNAQPANSGSYSVAVANPYGAVNSDIANLVVANALVNLADNFAARVVTNSLSGSVNGSNVGATREAGEPAHAGKPGGTSVWVAWVAPDSGVATFSTRGSGFDTVLAVYTGAGVGALVSVVSNEDSPNGFLTSEVTFTAVAGTPYQIVVDGFGGATGSIVLSWSLTRGADDAPRIQEAPKSQSVAAGANATFSVRATSRNPAELTYQWLLNDEPLFGEAASSLTVTNVRAANLGSYTVRVNTGTKSDLSTPAVLEIGRDPSVFTEDKFQDAISLGNGASTPRLAASGRRPLFTPPAAGVLDTQLFDNFGSGKEPCELNHAGVPGGRSRWYRITCPDDGILFIDTEGSVIDTVLEVYTGTNLCNLRLIASDNNSGSDGRSSAVSLSARRGSTYLTVVDSVGGSEGDARLNWLLAIPPTVSASPVDAAVLPGTTTSFTVAANGAPAPSYQWQFNGTDLPGATNATLTLGSVTTNQVGIYRAVVSNRAGQVLSNPAELSVSRAGALRFSQIGLLVGGRLQMRVEGAEGSKFVIEVSTNLIDPIQWTRVLTNTVQGGGFEFVEPSTENRPTRFYRAVSIP